MGARLSYALVTIVLMGIGSSALVIIRFTSRAGGLSAEKAGFRGFGHVATAVVFGVVLGPAFYALQGAPSLNRGLVTVRRSGTSRRWRWRTRGRPDGVPVRRVGAGQPTDFRPSPGPTLPPRDVRPTPPSTRPVGCVPDTLIKETRIRGPAIQDPVPLAKSRYVLSGTFFRQRREVVGASRRARRIRFHGAGHQV